MDEKLLRGISGGQGRFSLNQPNRIWPKEAWESTQHLGTVLMETWIRYLEEETSCSDLSKIFAYIGLVETHSGTRPVQAQRTLNEVWSRRASLSLVVFSYRKG